MPRGRPPKDKGPPSADMLDDPPGQSKETIESPVAPFVGTPEFTAAVAEATKRALESFASQTRTADPAAPIPADMANIFRGMALAIAEVGDQGTGRKRIPPEELAARKTAHDLCVQHILEGRERKLEAKYRVIGKIFFNEQFIEPFKMGPDKKPVPNEIGWTGMPNDALHPLNDVARKIFLAWRRSVGMPELISTDNYSSQPVWVTQNGLVVKGEAPAQRRAVAAEAVFSDELHIPQMPNDPTAAEVHVLGTIAAPARQSNLANQ